MMDNLKMDYFMEMELNIHRIKFNKGRIKLISNI